MAALAGLVLAIVPGGATRAWAAATVPVGPDQQFAATVNGAMSDARIAVACGPGAYRGHPRPGQSLAVTIPEVIMNPAFGDTGDRGRRIVARLAGAPPLAVFTTFTRGGPLWTATAPLPVTVWLPCTGTGVVVFTPRPWGTGAKTASVSVDFGAEAVVRGNGVVRGQ